MTGKHRDHRHLFTVHRHPEPHGEGARGRRNERWHPHVFWTHHHGPDYRRHEVWHWMAWALTWLAAILAFLQLMEAL